MQERNDILHYAISDIHGCYDKYISMLEKIGFNDGDTLYFLGDAVDRGPDGVKILLDTLIAGAGLCDEAAVRFTAENAKDAIDWLITELINSTIITLGLV